MVFDITPPKAARKKTSANRPEKHFAGQTELKNDRAVSPETNSDGLLQPISYEPVSDQSQVRKVPSNASPQSGPAQSSDSTAAGQPPVAGSSGAASSSKGSLDVGPSWLMVGGVGGDTDQQADSVEVLSGGWWSDKDVNAHFEVSVYETTTGRKLGEVFLSGNMVEGGATFNVDPCESEGSDLPGTKVPVKAVIKKTGGEELGSVSNVITLGDDTLAPRVHVVSTPARNSKVKEGDKIKLEVDATEVRSGGSWQTGLYIIQVTAPDGVVGDPWVNSAGPLSQVCDQKTWEHQYEATYTVPKNPPPIIELCALADDYAGNEGSLCGDFVTGDWYGTLREHAQGSIYNDTVEVRYSFSEERDGTIKGKGRVDNMTSEPQVWTGCTSTRTLNLKPDEAEFPISGKRVGDEFQLELPTDRRLTMNIKTDCPPPRRSGTTEGRRSLGMSEAFYHPKVKAQDGATNSFHKNLGGNFQVDATIEIHRVKQ